MRPTTANDIFDFNALIHPRTASSIRKTVYHSALTAAEKRAILASLASNASAIAPCPSMRSPAGRKKPVSIDDTLETLCELDGGHRNPRKPYRLRPIDLPSLPEPGGGSCSIET